MMISRTLLRLALCLAAPALALAAQAADDFSAAERALFVEPQLQGIQPPTTLRYSFRKSGSLESGFEDSVVLLLKAQPDGHCCVAEAQFLTGARRLPLPAIEASQGNPVILYFLERDIREMQRLTKGQQNYFRKRIRMAAYQGAQVREVTLSYRGHSIPGREIELTPYLDDPLRARFEKLANKRYVFTLAQEVPGGVYAIRTRVAGETPEAAPLLDEAMWAEGAAPLPASSLP